MNLRSRAQTTKSTAPSAERTVDIGHDKSIMCTVCEGGGSNEDGTFRIEQLQEGKVQHRALSMLNPLWDDTALLGPGRS